MAFDAEFHTWWDRLSEDNRVPEDGGRAGPPAAGDDTTAVADGMPAGTHRDEVGAPHRPEAGAAGGDQLDLAGAGSRVCAVPLTHR